jgi:hypothetical protein
MKMKKYLGKNGSAYFAAIVLCCALSLIFAACESTDEDTDKKEGIEQPNLITVNRTDGGRLIALAACKLFDNKKTTLKNLVLKAESEQNPSQTRVASEAERIKYGFDYVKIIGGTRYTANNVDIPLISEVCGKDEIDVIITSFVTYTASMQPDVSDVLIVFRSEKGIYACMLNEGGPGYSIFSSHKRFEQSAVVKDFTPPLYEFYIKNENGAIMLSGSLVSAEDGSYQKGTNLKWFPLQEKETTSDSNLFAIDELTAASQIEQQCTVTEIGKNYFLTTGDSNMKQVYFDEYTEFSVNGNPATPKDISVGDKITVTFDKLYEKYNPKAVFANKVIKE